MAVHLTDVRACLPCSDDVDARVKLAAKDIARHVQMTAQLVEQLLHEPAARLPLARAEERAPEAELRLELREHALAIEGRRERLRESGEPGGGGQTGPEAGEAKRRAETRRNAFLGPGRRFFASGSARALGADAREEGERPRDAPA